MSLSVFLNILGLCLGFMSAIFFSVGALTMTPDKIRKVASTYWDINENWGHSIAEQRADYIVGALLLLLSFSSQLSATLIPEEFQPSLLQPLGCAVAETVAVLTLLLMCSVLLRGTISKHTKLKVDQLQKRILAAQALEADVAKLKRQNNL